MSFTCRDLEGVLRKDDASRFTEARAHASSCARCREQLEVWEEIAAAAPSLRQSWESPQLWPRIHQALAEASQAASSRVPPKRAGWRLAAATGAVLMALGGSWLALRSMSPTDVEISETERRLLTERALRDVERSEAAYVESIERLTKMAEPLVQAPASPLLVSYREKLQLLDAAIADCRVQIERNRFNAHLRKELLSMYQEKQRTLEQLMKEEGHAL